MFMQFNFHFIGKLIILGKIVLIISFTGINKIVITNSKCCGTMKFNNQTFTHFPMTSIAMSVESWNEVGTMSISLSFSLSLSLSLSFSPSTCMYLCIYLFLTGNVSK